MRANFILYLIAFNALAAISKADTVSLSPTTWPAGTLEKYYKLNDEDGATKGADGRIHYGAAAGTSSAIATYVAQDCLTKLGSAVDCAIAAAMTQITIAGGSYVSFAGISSFVYYDASTQQTVTLNGYWNAPKGETNPVTMPPPGSLKDIGRTVLVTGLFRAMEAAHKKYGVLPWTTLFEPAIYFATQGFPFTNMLARQLKAFQSVALRTKEGQAVFTNPQTGKIYQRGELFVQPELAEVLTNVASQGADYIYQGDFAQQLVKAVQSANGTLTLDDMKAYQPTWSKPLTTSYMNEYQVNTLSYPSYGGLAVIETLNLLEQIDFTTIGRYNESAQALFQMIQIARWSPLTYLIGAVNPVGLQKAFPGIDMSWQGRATKQTAQSVWNIMNGPNGKKEIDSRLQSAFPGHHRVQSLMQDPKHSDGFVCIDNKGNAITMVHSINSMPWGTAIFVKGIALSNAGSINILQLMQAGPGGRVPDPLEPTILTKNGVPVYLSASIGGGVHEIDVQNVVNVQQFGMSPVEANSMPHFFSINFGGDHSKFPANQSVPIGGKRGFTRGIVTEVIEMGQPITEVPVEVSSTSTPGFWVGATTNYDQGYVSIAAPVEFNGWAVVD